VATVYRAVEPVVSTRKYVEFCRAKARQNQSQLPLAQHLREVPMPEMVSSPFFAEKGLL
jgi:hypothetical protein